MHDPVCVLQLQPINKPLASIRVGATLTSVFVLRTGVCILSWLWDWAENWGRCVLDRKRLLAGEDSRHLLKAQAFMFYLLWQGPVNQIRTQLNSTRSPEHAGLQAETWTRCQHLPAASSSPLWTGRAMSLARHQMRPTGRRPPDRESGPDGTCCSPHSTQCMRADQSTTGSPPLGRTPEAGREPATTTRLGIGITVHMAAEPGSRTCT